MVAVKNHLFENLLIFCFSTSLIFLSCNFSSSSKKKEKKEPDSKTESLKPFAVPQDSVAVHRDDLEIDFSTITFWETSSGSGKKCGTYDPQTGILEFNTQWKAGVLNPGKLTQTKTFDASDYNYICFEYEPTEVGGPTNLPFRIKVLYEDESSEIQICERKRTKLYYRLKSQSKKSVSQIQIWCTTQEPISYKIKSLRFTQNKEVIPVVDKGSKNFDSSISAINLVKDMGIGWNLGNSFDAHSFGWQENYWERGIEAEFDWEKTETTKEILAFPKAHGYKTLRIPVTWYCHIIDDKYTIDPDWMLRVKTIVDYALEQGYYVILNEHHSVHGDHTTQHKTTAGKEHEYLYRRMPTPLGYADGYLVSSNSKDIAESKRFLKAIWTQISAAFNNGYDERLIFETMNEPRNSRDDHPATEKGQTDHEWQPALMLAYHKKADGKTLAGYWCDNRECLECKKEYKILNEYNQVCLDAIRASGGNNEKRFVMIPGLCTNSLTVLPKIELEDKENGIGIFGPGLFKMPDDIAKNKNDNRLNLTVHENPSWKQNEGNTVFAPRMQNEITEKLRLLDENFVQKGIPVVIGETGTDRNSICFEERAKWIKHLVSQARNYGMSVVWWDCGSGEEAYAQINRSKLEFYESDFVQIMLDAMYAQ